ncbi:NAD(P)/FAD-dependent oxidoreductase [Flavihumibacter rivuli]|uniref:NAD(P)/FAD-dependent oxidoreductase n=1 Tax=Flavihumibacter rivuli TaxID=2838156 RepID=UPI001BDDFD63|nr:NAD(P)/FAD-dependent oxidoreductase [Flavihumibacter rivuli]ULQ58435.1 NAD(P)/FAD-dependent oxidoreductase [Flavihumibacter rivuli]
MKKENVFDVTILGGSYAGLAAGMALGRALRKVLIIDAGNPCNRQTPYSHNFLTNDGKTPKEIAELARQEVKKYDSVSFIDGFATAGKMNSNGIVIQILSGETFLSRKLVIATGIKDLMPDIPGFAECWGKSVLHCPYCHGYEVRHQKTGIFANGDTAFELATLISNWTNDLTLYTNGKSTITAQQLLKLQEHKINIVEAEIERLENKAGYISNIVFSNGTSAQAKAIYTRLPFVQHSSIPQALGCELTPEGYLKIDSAHRTTVHGIYACGDNATRMRTVANAVAMGTTTGLMVNKDLIEEDF